MDPPCKHSRSWNPGGHSFGGTSCMYNYTHVSIITDVHPTESDFLRRGLLMCGQVFNAGCFPFSPFGRYRISL